MRWRSTAGGYGSDFKGLADDAEVAASSGRHLGERSGDIIMTSSVGHVMSLAAWSRSRRSLRHGQAQELARPDRASRERRHCGKMLRKHTPDSADYTVID